MKRPAAAFGTTRVAKRPALQQDAVAEKCALVAGALTEAAFLSPSVVKMFGPLTYTLGVPKAERHVFQAQVVDMVGEALDGIQKAMEENIVKAQEKVDSFAEEQTKRVAVSTEANQRLAELVDESSKKKTALSEATNEVKAAQAAQKTAKEAQINGQIEFQQAAGKMAALEKLMSDHFEPLKEGSLQSKAAIKTSVTEVVQYGRLNDIDASIVSMVPKVFKPVEERGTFDALVIGQIGDALTGKLVALRKLIDEGDTVKTSCADALATAKTAVEAAIARKHQCQAQATEAAAAVPASMKSLAAAEKSVLDLGIEVSVAQANLELARKKVELFVSHAKVAYNELRDLAPKPVSADEGSAEDQDEADLKEEAAPSTDGVAASAEDERPVGGSVAVERSPAGDVVMTSSDAVEEEGKAVAGAAQDGAPLTDGVIASEGVTENEEEIGGDSAAVEGAPAGDVVMASVAETTEEQVDTDMAPAEGVVQEEATDKLHAETEVEVEGGRAGA